MPDLGLQLKVHLKGTAQESGGNSTLSFHYNVRQSTATLTLYTEYEMSACIHHDRDLQRALNYNPTGETIGLLLGICFIFRKWRNKGLTRQGLIVRSPRDMTLWPQPGSNVQYPRNLPASVQVSTEVQTLVPQPHPTKKGISILGREHFWQNVRYTLLTETTLVMRKWLSQFLICWSARKYS